MLQPPPKETPMPMTPRAGLQVADDLAAFIEAEVLPALDLDANAFWAGARRRARKPARCAIR